MKWVQRIELSLEEETRLIEHAQNGDATARNVLITSHLPFIRLKAKERRCPSWLEPDDLVQAAVFGFIRAIEKWDAAKGCRLLGYAKFWIRAAIDTEIEFSQLYRVPDIVKYCIKSGRKVGEKTRQAAANYKPMTFFSEHEPQEISHHSTDPTVEIERKDEREWFNGLISQLDAVQQKVLRLRLAGMTLEQIGVHLELGTRENVRLVERAARQQLVLLLSPRLEAA